MPRPFFMRALCGRFGSSGDAPGPPYQQWNGYPQSPDFTSSYPYQLIYSLVFGGTTYYRLVECTSKMYWSGGRIGAVGSYDFIILQRNGSSWESAGTGHQNVTSFFDDASSFSPELLQCNNDVYTSSTLNTVLLAKTTA